EVVGTQASPEGGLVLLRPQRRSAHELRALEAGPRHVVLREEEVLRAGLGEGVLPPVAGLDDGVERRLRGEVDDVERCAGDLREADRAGCRLPFPLALGAWGAGGG